MIKEYLRPTLLDFQFHTKNFRRLHIIVSIFFLKVGNYFHKKLNHHEVAPQ
jgi:hypothetical protein